MAVDARENLDTAGERGPAEHHRRVQLLEAADQHFRRYGYKKTTVADLARAVAVSPAYVYRFFDSKQAIGEAVCNRTLGTILDALHQVEAERRSASERLRRVFRALVEKGFDLFAERKLHDIVAAAIDENWASPANFKHELALIVRRLLVAGREAGEFERKTPIDDVTKAIFCTLLPFGHPVFLEQTERSELEANAEQVAALVLRSLAP